MLNFDRARASQIRQMLQDRHRYGRMGLAPISSQCYRNLSNGSDQEEMIYTVRQRDVRHL
jgi:hypothetical protein